MRQRVGYAVLGARMGRDDFLGGVFGRGQGSVFPGRRVATCGGSFAGRLYVRQRVGYAILLVWRSRGDFLGSIFGRGQVTVVRVLDSGDVCY